jgi:hypothetical protein|tara:strand:+ start:1145 stop:1279 length:135 start_codon:yes stop_codon:yes gene_type:complete
MILRVYQDIEITELKKIDRELTITLTQLKSENYDKEDSNQKHEI